MGDFKGMRPLCPHSAYCGGCIYQGVPYEQQLAEKEREVHRLLEEKNVHPVRIDAIAGCPTPYAYRNKMEYTFGDFVKDGPLALGMHRKKNFMSIVTVDECQLVHPDFNTVLKAVLQFCEERGYAFYHKKSHKGLLRNLILRRGVRTGELLVNIVTSSEEGFDEAAFGGKKVIRLQSSNGGVQNYEVNIPAGIESGKSIRLKGKGYPGVGGGEAGDLLLKVNVQDKPGYKREGRDVYTTVNIPFTTAVFGGEAKVHTIYGDVLCNIKPGTQSGTKIRLRGKGIVAMNNPSVHGDEYATVQIEVPTNLTPDARRKLKEFEQECNGSRRSRGFGSGSAA